MVSTSYIEKISEEDLKNDWPFKTQYWNEKKKKLEFNSKETNEWESRTLCPNKMLTTSPFLSLKRKEGEVMKRQENFFFFSMKRKRGTDKKKNIESTKILETGKMRNRSYCIRCKWSS